MLRPGGVAAVVVPAGPGTYDYYDRFLGHERRYARGELAQSGERAGFEVLDDAYLGSLALPGVLGGQEAQPPPPPQPRRTQTPGARGARHRAHQGSRLGALTTALERELLARGSDSVRHPRLHRLAGGPHER